MSWSDRWWVHSKPSTHIPYIKSENDKPGSGGQTLSLPLSILFTSENVHHMMQKTVKANSNAGLSWDVIYIVQYVWEGLWQCDVPVPVRSIETTPEAHFNFNQKNDPTTQVITTLVAPATVSHLCSVAFPKMPLYFFLQRQVNVNKSRQVAPIFPSQADQASQVSCPGHVNSIQRLGWCVKAVKKSSRDIKKRMIFQKAFRKWAGGSWFQVWPANLTLAG